MVCHQRAERSFNYDGAQMPVCARCTGLYLAGAGGLLTGLFLTAVPRAPRVKRRLQAAFSNLATWRAALILAVLPMLASVGFEWLGVWPGSNLSRALTALPAGWVVGVMVAESLSFGVRL